VWTEDMGATGDGDVLEVQSSQTSVLVGAMGVGMVIGAGTLLELQSSQTSELELVGATGLGVVVVVGSGLLEELQSAQWV
jgi:hypothetical protein